MLYLTNQLCQIHSREIMTNQFEIQFTKLQADSSYLLSEEYEVGV